MATGVFAPVNRMHINQTNVWLPVIRVSLSDSDDPNITHIVDDDVLAIIDTGSTCCCIDEKYIATHKTFIDTGRRTPMTGATGKKDDAPIYWVQIVVDGHTLQMPCPSIPLHSDDNPCDLLFGMDAIRYFDFSLHRYPQKITLTWIQQ
jgi:hypothetical protein